MSWKCFKLLFKIKSPLHIGYGAKLGVIERTRYYIPGKTIWGALTAKLTREINGSYEDVGEFVRKHLIFSYFYLKHENKVYFPIYDEGGLKFGDISKEEFEKRFITSYISTALEKDSRTAEEGSLHEFELISNKNKNTRSVAEIIGYLFTDLEENKGSRENSLTYLVKEINNNFFKLEINGRKVNILEVIKNLQMGGERVYGLGYLNLKNEDIKLYEKVEQVYLYNSGIKVNLTNLNIITNNGNFKALAHVRINGLNFEFIKGDLEPFVMRKWNKKGAGQNIEFEGVCISPGSRFKIEDTFKVKIGDYGIWQINGQNQKRN